MASLDGSYRSIEDEVRRCNLKGGITKTKDPTISRLSPRKRFVTQVLTAELIEAAKGSNFTVTAPARLGTGSKGTQTGLLKPLH